MDLKSELDRVLVGPSAPGRRLDGWKNALTGLGTVSFDKRQSATFELEIVSTREAQALWAGDGIGGRIIEKWPDEMVRAGWDLTIGSEGEPDEEEAERADALPPELADADTNPERERARARQEKTREVERQISEIKKKWKKLGVRAALRRALEYERAYGGALILLGTNDGNSSFVSPLDVERVRTFDWLTVHEPDECNPIAWYDNPREGKYGEPKLWQIVPKTSGTASAAPLVVHESRVIVFEGIRTTSGHEPGASTGFGHSLLTRVHKTLRDFNLGWDGAAVLMQDFAQAVYKIEGLASLFGSDNDDAIIERFRAVELGRSIVRATIIDTNEEFGRQQTPLTGLPDLLDKFGSRLAADVGMPLTVLMGVSPGGLNATGESDITLFYDSIASAQMDKLEQPLGYLTRIIMSALDIPEPSQWEIKFNPLWQASETEQATARKTQAETDVAYINAGVLSPEEVASNRFGGGSYSFETSIDFDDREDLERLERQRALETQMQMAALNGGGDDNGDDGDKPPSNSDERR